MSFQVQVYVNSEHKFDAAQDVVPAVGNYVRIDGKLYVVRPGDIEWVYEYDGFRHVKMHLDG